MLDYWKAIVWPITVSIDRNRNRGGAIFFLGLIKHQGHYSGGHIGDVFWWVDNSYTCCDGEKRKNLTII